MAKHSFPATSLSGHHENERFIVADYPRSEPNPLAATWWPGPVPALQRHQPTGVRRATAVPGWSWSMPVEAPPPAPPKPDDEPDERSRKQRFLDAYSPGANIKAVATLTGVGTKTLYEWRRDDPVFRATMDRRRQVL